MGHEICVLDLSCLLDTDPLGSIRTNVTVQVRYDMKHTAFPSLIRRKVGLDAGVGREKRKVLNSKLWRTITCTVYILQISIITHNWICIVIPDIALTWINVHSCFQPECLQDTQYNVYENTGFPNMYCLSFNIKWFIIKSDLI